MLQRNTIIEKSPACIHLSSSTIKNQVSFGSALPGRQNAIVESISHTIAGQNDLIVILICTIDTHESNSIIRTRPGNKTLRTLFQIRSVHAKDISMWQQYR